MPYITKKEIGEMWKDISKVKLPKTKPKKHDYSYLKYWVLFVLLFIAMKFDMGFREIFFFYFGFGLARGFRLD